MSSASEFTPAVSKPVKDAKPAGEAAKAAPEKFHMKPWMKWAAAGIGLLILAAIIWHFVEAYLASHKKPPPPPPVHVAAVAKADVVQVQHTIATVVSPAAVQINAQVAGKLLTAYFKEGDIVHKGDPLFLIDPGPFQNALLQAQAQLAKDQATAQSDLNDEKRYITLYAENATSQQQRDISVATAKGAVAQVNSDQAAVNIAQENLGYTKIVSPIDGKTGPIVIQPGNLITVAGATPLVTITQVQPIKVSFFLPQNQLTQIQNQMTQGKLLATVPMPGAPNGHEQAAVDFISNTVSATTGTIELRATFTNADMRLVPGQSVNVGITIGQISGATVVPRDAVNVGPDASFVYVVDQQSKAIQKTVKVLNDDGVNDAIQGDVKPGDKVIVEGQLRVVAGATVAVQKGKAPPAPSTADSDMPS